jgi:hypothetical protein
MQLPVPDLTETTGEDYGPHIAGAHHIDCSVSETERSLPVSLKSISISVSRGGATVVLIQGRNLKSTEKWLK